MYIRPHIHKNMHLTTNKIISLSVWVALDWNRKLSKLSLNLNEFDISASVASISARAGGAYNKIQNQLFSIIWTTCYERWRIRTVDRKGSYADIWESLIAQIILSYLYCIDSNENMNKLTVFECIRIRIRNTNTVSLRATMYHRYKCIFRRMPAMSYVWLQLHTI